MNVEIEGGEISPKRLVAPPSKSYTHRAITISSLSNGKSIVENPLLSEDTLATVDGCKALGADIDRKDSELVIDGFGADPEIPNDVIDLKNSGTSLRFLTGVASHLKKGYTVLTGDNSLKNRPNEPLINALNDLGAEIHSTKLNGTAPIIIKGRLQGGYVEIKGDISSQFISSILINTPIAPENSEIKVTTKIRSKPYIDITLEVMEKAGIKIAKEGKAYKVKGNNKYEPIEMKIPGDFSSASNILALAAISNQEIEMKGLSPSKQGDEKILEILERFGAKIIHKKDTVKVKPEPLTGITIDASNIPDLLPILSVIGTQAEGKTKIHNVEHARYKESDRIKAMATELKKMGAQIKEHQDGLTIKESSLKGTKLNGYDDHRIVMALSIAATQAEGKTTINTAESIKISYPNFFNHLKKVGVEVDKK
ncbi:3-phosphoshikimate 1-carboxyvinyltransferase [Methanonatronarchaeum sp. AMET-Sl]|uniref:3-phosphoshikimate 1-carboxyvinyltransferase n=1 Tax=Methanonatronarchaeum sp. AMET-Sl TaxID=3037654 RepID=UPI00244E493C|nr:3-phosphoshikimate 1-carboxyvinyltransferase [Methanonatronarchaeum sp. AMET-Sl]WGI17079.1 3-phosphoshikimate 1-carboxyvinyltransferase [Methanonatronarchaeum sp. AMET-Sl]